jgi:aromatic-L-amino-acid/L-tryptophan decarboxylase
MHHVDQTTEQMCAVSSRTRRTAADGSGAARQGNAAGRRLYKALNGVIRDRIRAPDEVSGIYSSVIAPTINSADSPRFVGFIPAAPTKASLLFVDLVRLNPGHLLA